MDEDKIISKPCFYGGEIKCILGPIHLSNLDMILDIIDDYLDILDAVESSRSTA